VPSPALKVVKNDELKCQILSECTIKTQERFMLQNVINDESLMPDLNIFDSKFVGTGASDCSNRKIKIS
jgi:hypothetical protein